MNRHNTLSLILTAALFLLPGCSDRDRAALHSVTGSVSNGTVSQAMVRAYRIDRISGNTVLVAESETDTAGSFALDLRLPGPFLILASGGDYTDQATGESRSLDDAVDVSNVFEPRTTGLELLIGYADDVELPESVSLTALSTIASRRSVALAELDVSEFAESVVVGRSETVATEFGLGAIDVRSIEPLDLTQSAQAAAIQSSTADPGVRAGALIAALSQCASDLGLEDFRSLLEVLADDFEDGIMNGRSGSEILSIDSTPVSTGLGDFELARSLERFLASPRNASGTMAGDFEPFLELVATQEPIASGANRAPAFTTIESQVIQSLAPARALDSQILVTDPGEVLNATVMSEDANVASVNWVTLDAGVLSFNLIPVAVGETELVITVNDDGGTLNGGRDTVVDRLQVHVTEAPVGRFDESNWDQAAWGN